MKKVNIQLRLLLIFFMFLCLSVLKSQSFQKQDSLIRILKINTFLISNPAPQYIVEIRNDMTIHFYNNLPENFTKHQSELLGDWIIDSIAIMIDGADFIDLEETILGIDLSNIDNYQKSKSESGIEFINAGGISDKYIIELSNQTINFSCNRSPEDDCPISIKTIRNKIEELKDKYEPVR